MAAALRASLIISTKNRESSLRRCLEYVRLLEMPRSDWELIVVDNGSTDGTRGIIDEFARSVDFSVIGVYERRLGSGWGKNAGIARATGRVLAFTDDDCYVRPDFLVQVCRIFETEAVGYLGGRLVIHDPTDAPVATEHDESPAWVEPYSVLPAGSIRGANMAALRSVANAIGGFDPLFGSGARFTGEDIDFAARASWAGWKGKYDPAPVVAHHHGRKRGAAAESRRREYDFGRGAYYAKFLLNATTRRAYLRHWIACVRTSYHGGPSSTLREIAGALAYVVLRAGRRPHDGASTS